MLHTNNRCFSQRDPSHSLELLTIIVYTTKDFGHWFGSQIEYEDSLEAKRAEALNFRSMGIRLQNISVKMSKVSKIPVLVESSNHLTNDTL